jgi:ribosomal protein L9
MLDVFSRNHIKEGLDRCLKGVKAGDAWSMSLVLPYIGNYGSAASEALPYLEKLMNDAAGKKAQQNKKNDKTSGQLESVYNKIKNGKPVELIPLADYLEKQSKQGSK